MLEEKKKKKSGEKKEKRVRPFWGRIISAYFDFCRSKFGETPSFDGSSPRDLGMIVDAIEKKAAEKNIIWTEDVAVRSCNLFFQYAWEDNWLQNNFLLFNLNRQKDKIFFKIKSDLDGKSNSKSQTGKHIGSFKTAGQELFAERLRGRIEKLQRDGQDDN